MRRLAIAAALVLSLQACTSTNNTAANEPAKPAPSQPAKPGQPGQPGQPAQPAANNNNNNNQGSNGGMGLLGTLENDVKKEEAHFKQHGGPVLTSCRDDAHKMCAAAGMDPTKLLGCLKQNEAKLMPPCKTALAAYAKTHK